MTQLYMRLDTGEYIMSPYEAEKQLRLYFGKEVPIKIPPRVIRKTDGLKRVLFIVKSMDLVTIDREDVTEEQRKVLLRRTPFNPKEESINWPSWASRTITVGDFFKEFAHDLIQKNVYGRCGGSDIYRMKYLYVQNIMVQGTPHVVMNGSGRTIFLSQAGLELMRKFYA